jgi:hypothetical protein
MGVGVAMVHTCNTRHNSLAQSTHKQQLTWMQYVPTQHTNTLQGGGRLHQGVVRPGKGGGRGGVRVSAGVHTDTRHVATRRNPHPNSSSHARHTCQRTTQTAFQGQGRPQQGGVRGGRRVGLHTVGRVLAGTPTHATQQPGATHTQIAAHMDAICASSTHKHPPGRGQTAPGSGEAGQRGREGRGAGECWGPHRHTPRRHPAQPTPK